MWQFDVFNDMWRNVYTIVIILIVLVAEDAWSSFYSSTRTWSHFNAPSSSANCNTRATRPCWYIFSSSPYLPSSNYSQLLTNGLQSSCANLSSLLIIMCSIHFHFSNSHPPLFYTLPFHPPFIATCLLCVHFLFHRLRQETFKSGKYGASSFYYLIKIHNWTDSKSLHFLLTICVFTCLKVMFT